MRPADQNSPPSRIRRLEETGGLEPNPKPSSSQLVQGLIASKQKASSQAQPNIAPAWSTQVEETKKKTGARVLLLEETESLEPTPNPNLVLVWSGKVQLVQGECPAKTSSAGNWGLEPNPKANLLLVWSGRCNWFTPPP